MSALEKFLLRCRADEQEIQQRAKANIAEIDDLLSKLKTDELAQIAYLRQAGERPPAVPNAAKGEPSRGYESPAETKAAGESSQVNRARCGPHGQWKGCGAVILWGKKDGKPAPFNEDGTLHRCGK